MGRDTVLALPAQAFRGIFHGSFAFSKIILHLRSPIQVCTFLFLILLFFCHENRSAFIVGASCIKTKTMPLVQHWRILIGCFRLMKTGCHIYKTILLDLLTKTRQSSLRQRIQPKHGMWWKVNMGVYDHRKTEYVLLVPQSNLDM
jgi:hypothetical protein